MLSLGIEAALAFSIAVASAALPAGSPPPSRAATWTARASLVKSWPRLASVAFFLCLIDAHLECPDTPEQSRSGLAVNKQGPAAASGTATGPWSLGRPLLRDQIGAS